MANARWHIVLLLLSVCLACVFLLSLLIGSADINIESAIADRHSIDGVILFSVRLPRTLAAFLAGLAFAASGALIQNATANDLASPNIIGMNSGSGFAVLLFLSLFPHLFGILPFVAFIGGLAAVSIVFVISSFIGRISSSSSIILAGIAVNALFNALISTISSLDPDVMSSYSAFSIGGFSSVQASSLYVPSLIILISILVSFLMTGWMNVLKLGDEIASSMGYNPKIIRIVLVIIAALLSSSAVTFSGLLGFVGLVTPHLASLISGGECRRSLILTFFIGPILVILSDLLARTLVMPGELPAGVFMVVLGVPFFIFLLVRRGRR